MHTGTGEVLTAPRQPNTTMTDVLVHAAAVQGSAKGTAPRAKLGLTHPCRAASCARAARSSSRSAAAATISRRCSATVCCSCASLSTAPRSPASSRCAAARRGARLGCSGAHGRAPPVMTHSPLYTEGHKEDCIEKDCTEGCYAAVLLYLLLTRGGYAVRAPAAREGVPLLVHSTMGRLFSKMLYLLCEAQRAEVLRDPGQVLGRLLQPAAPHRTTPHHTHGPHVALSSATLCNAAGRTARPQCRPAGQAAMRPRTEGGPHLARCSASTGAPCLVSSK